MENTNPYELLGIPESATPAEAEARYRELMHAWSVERYGENLHLQRVAEGRRREIQAAYDAVCKRASQAAVVAAAPPAPAPAAQLPPPRHDRRRRLGLEAAAVLVIAAAVCIPLWWYIGARAGEPPPAAPVIPAAPARTPEAAHAAAAAPNSTAAHVAARQRSFAAPANGAELMPAAGRTGSGTLRIVNQTDRDAVATVLAGGHAVRMLYISAGSEATAARLGADVYRVRLELGRGWQPARRAFARARASAGPYGPFTFVEVEGVSGRDSDHYDVVVRP